MSHDLVQFLRDRLDEDEAAARATEWCAGTMTFNGWDECRVEEDHYEVRSRGATIARGMGPEFAHHITRHDPARVLADIEAKRRIISDYEKAVFSLAAAGQSGTAYDLMTGATNALANTLRVLALPYVDHPSFKEGWRP